MRHLLHFVVMLASLGCGSNSSTEGTGGSGGSGGSGPGGSSSGGSGPGGASTGGSGATGGTGGVGAGVPCDEIESFSTEAKLVGNDGDDDIAVDGIMGTVTAPVHTCSAGESPLAVDAGGKPWEFCLPTNGQVVLPVEVGQEVSFDFEDFSDVDVGEFYTVFALYDATGDLTYFSSAGPAKIGQGFDVDQGAYLCGGDTDEPKCIETRTSVTFTAGEESIELGPLEVGSLDGLEFHVSYALDVSDGGACDSNTGFLLYYFAVKAQ